MNKKVFFCQPVFHWQNTHLFMWGQNGEKGVWAVNTTPVWVSYDVSFRLTASRPVTALTLFLSIFHPQTICPAEYLKIPLGIQKLCGMKCSEYPLPIFPHALGTVFRWASVQVKIEVLSWYHVRIRQAPLQASGAGRVSLATVNTVLSEAIN